MFDRRNLHDKYCVAFIDILGFKSLTSRHNLEQSGLFIDDAIERMKSITTIEKEKVGQRAGYIKTLQFADSVVLLFEKDPYTCLLAATKLMSLQFQLATKGIFLRGAICSGQMYVDLKNDIYYGEAWNKAVLQEGRAIYPRILIENSLATMVTDWLKLMDESVFEFYLSEDGYHVLDTYKGHYWLDGKLRGLSTDFGYRLMMSAIQYRAFLDNIDDGVLRKYYWVANTLRENITQYPELKDEIENLCGKILKRLI